MGKQSVWLVLGVLVMAAIAGSAQGQVLSGLERRNPDDNSGDTAPVIVAGGLVDGALVFIDRTHVYTEIPEFLVGADYVMVANDDKDNANMELDLTLSQNATLYLLIDHRVGDGSASDPPTVGDAAMGWVLDMGFVNTEQQLSIDEDADGSINNYATIYALDVPAGTIMLLPQDDGGSRNMYGIAALPRGGGAKASEPIPADGATDVPRDRVLSWRPGELAATHDVYLGTVAGDVEAASSADALGVLVSQGQDAKTYDPAELLEFGRTYYWRVDEVNGAPDYAVFKGDVWSFTAESLAYPIESVVATASSTHLAEMGPEKTVDGSGLNENDLHSTTGTDMWLSGGAATEAAWIQYEFDRVYKLHEMWVWNSNQQIESFVRMGAKSVTIEYSTDAVTWTVLDGVSDFNQAPGTEGYAHNSTVDFGGAMARYVKITINDNYGLLTQTGLSEVRFYSIPVSAREPYPAVGQADVSLDVVFTWRSGRQASAHEVYFSSEEQAVVDGTALVDTVSEGRYQPRGLVYGQTYYWKINEVNEPTGSVVEGDVWNFTTVRYFVVEDMESYDDDLDAGTAIFQTWIDGWDNGSGATVGYLTSPFAEQSIVNSGRQSMPLDYNNINSPWYSETERTWDSAQDWTVDGATHLIVHFRGNAVGFVQTSPDSFTMGAAGADIWNSADEFRYAFKKLNGDGSIVARVDSLIDVNAWVKGGVMIRESLDPGSAFAAVYVSTGNGCRFQARAASNSAAISDTGVVTPEQTAIVAPYWVKLERTGNDFNGFYSADGVTWTAMAWNPQAIAMIGNVYVGLALTSHLSGVSTTGEFSNVATTGNVSGAWQAQAIGVAQPANDPASLYVAVEDSAGHLKAVTNPDGNATLASTWQAWPIPLSDFAGVNMAKVSRMIIGAGDRDNPTPGGAGLLYVDDIQVGVPAPVAEPNDPAAP